MSHPEQIARQLNLKPAQITAVIELLDAGNTLPFVARYRKEATGGLDEEQLRQISETLARLRNLDERRQTILTTIESQEKLTPELRRQITTAATLAALEDLYQPYKPKRRTRATMAREKGLQPLADLILAQAHGGPGAGQLAQPFLSDSVPSLEEALAGARDIVAETISDHPGVRGRLRDKAMRWGLLRCQKIESSADPRRLYELYYAYEIRVDRLRPHQTLAINRGEKEKVLHVQVSLAERDWQEAVTTVFRVQRQSPLADQLRQAAADAAQRLLLPAIERDVRRALTAEAEAHAITVFAANLRGLLSQPPLAGQTILGIDPAFRTGCKVAVVDPTGKVLDSVTIYPHEPQKRADEALRTLVRLANVHKVSLVAIGNGTASRETEQLVAELINRQQRDLSSGRELQYLMVNEAGASVYSASPLARAELPNLDVSMRGAVSIARRVQDPLAELVKIDAKAIGIGLYQHDVNQSRLAAALDGVVESVVNNVGVDANTASPALLRYVAGIGPKIAERIVSYRDENGPFTNRRTLLKVPGLGKKAFEQAAGFLRIRGGDNPLDGSAIHPESYPVAEAVLRQAGLSPQTPPAAREPALAQWRAQRPLTALAAELGTGVPTLADILEQLVRPGRDPRADLPPPILRHDVLSMDDLRPGMRLQGTVRNVVDFGAFVDIGVKQDGLLHRSQLPRGAILSVGDVLEVAVLSVEPERGRISLASIAPDW
jgi:protein Tex